MLREIGLTSMDQLHDAIPDHLKLKREMDLPPAMNEYELRWHIEGILAKNKHGADYLNFWGRAAGSILFRQSATKLTSAPSS